MTNLIFLYLMRGDKKNKKIPCFLSRAINKKFDIKKELNRIIKKTLEEDKKVNWEKFCKESELNKSQIGSSLRSENLFDVQKIHNDIIEKISLTLFKDDEFNLNFLDDGFIYFYNKKILISKSRNTRDQYEEIRIEFDQKQKEFENKITNLGQAERECYLDFSNLVEMVCYRNIKLNL